jgi:hypothetical protein
MMARLPVAAVCTILCACGATQPLKPERVPEELVPAGFSAADCHVVEPAQALTETGPDGRPMTVGSRQPKVECQKSGQSVVTTKSVPVCHTTGGKKLPLADCCMTESGDPIPACTPKLQPLGE